MFIQRAGEFLYLNRFIDNTTYSQTMHKEIFLTLHDNGMAWERFLHYWPFVSITHPWPVDSHIGRSARGFGISFNVSLNEMLDKQSR